MNCPQCHAAILREGQKFCTSCGYSLIAEGTASEPSVLETFASRTAQQIKPLLSPEPEVRPAESDGPVALPSLRSRRKRSAPRKLREAYFELGRALAAADRHEEAFKALQCARNAAGSTSAAEIQYEVARTAEAAGESSRAIRAWLEFAQMAPAELGSVLKYLHSRLNSTLATELREWSCKEWGESFNEQTLNATQRAQVAAFVGRVHLLVGEHQEALVAFTKAIQASREQAIPAVLQFVEDALKALPPGDSDTLAPLQELKGRVLLKTGDTEEAAELLYEAGKNFNWRNEGSHSVEALRTAVELRRNHAPSHWYLADSLRLLAENDKEQLTEAARIWDEAAATIGLPQPDFAWAYTARALINEQLAEESVSDPVAGWRLYCAAIVLLERGLIANSQFVYNWANLARFLAIVNLEWNAIEAARAALECDKDNIFAVTQLAQNLTYTGDFRGAEKLIDDILTKQPDAYAEGLKGYLLLLTGRFAEAVNILSSAIEKAPDAPWYREQRATARERLGKMADAQQDWEFVLSLHESERTKVDFSTALAAYKLERRDKAIDFLKRRREVPMETMGLASRYLGLAEMTAGDWENGSKHLIEGIDQTTFAWRLVDFAQFDFATFKRTIGDKTEWKGRLLEQFDQAIDARVKQLEQEPGNPLGEATLQLNLLEAEGRSNKIEGIMARALLARLYRSSGDWLESARLYEGLAADPEKRFPEAADAFIHTMTELTNQAAQLLRAGEFTATRERFVEPALILAQEVELPDGNITARLLTQKAVAHFFESELTKAEKEFASALERFRAVGPTSAGQSLGQATQELLEEPARYWAVDDFWRKVGDALDVNESVRQEIASARKTLTGFLDSHLALRRDDTASQPPYWMVTPILIDIESHMAPSDPDDWHLLKDDLPSMRERIRKDTGVQIPAVRFRENAEGLAVGTYIISLREVPTVMGTIEPDPTAPTHTEKAPSVSANSSPWMRYCEASPESAQAIGLPPDGLKPAPHPLTGAPGCWIPSKHWALIENAGLKLWPEPTTYMVMHLEVVLRKNLAEFLDVQETVNWLATAPEEMTILVKQAVPDAAARLKLTQILRRLVEEHVPIINHAVILESFVAQRDQELPVIVGAIRLKLRTQLPGNDSSTKQIALPPEIESTIIAAVTGIGARRCLALTPAQTQDVLASIRELIPVDKSGLALLVQDGDVRPFVRKLVQLEWPALSVLAADELSTDSVNLTQSVTSSPEAVHA
jgi:tetratricopeptide (TPR) repeat protein